MEKKQDEFSSQSYAKQEELTKILNDFTAAVLLHKPNDIYSYAREYFTTFHKVSADSKGNVNLVPVVVCGPSGVGKGTCNLIISLTF
jgi:guanylate kinase